MRFFKLFLAGECMAEVHYESAVQTISDVLGKENVDKVLYALSQGDRVSLMNRWQIEEKLV